MTTHNTMRVEGFVKEAAQRRFAELRLRAADYLAQASGLPHLDPHQRQQARSACSIALMDDRNPNVFEDGDRVEVRDGQVWLPGVVVGFDDSIDGLHAIDVDLDEPDRNGRQHIWVSSMLSIRKAEGQP
jgi:hypothetical protein